MLELENRDDDELMAGVGNADLRTISTAGLGTRQGRTDGARFGPKQLG